MKCVNGNERIATYGNKIPAYGNIPRYGNKMPTFGNGVYFTLGLTKPWGALGGVGGETARPEHSIKGKQMEKRILSSAVRAGGFARLLPLLAFLLVQSVWAGANYESEKEKADQLIPGLPVGTAQYLEAQGHKFLALYTEAANAKAGLVIVHGSEFNPDQGLIGVLRKQLPQHGYTTLSIQMPVLGFEGRGNQYSPLYPEAADRIKEAVKSLQDKGYKKIAIVSHSVGSSMTLAYLKDNANAVVVAWVSIGMPAASFDGAALPIYDLYGENDIPPVLNTAHKRAGTLSNSKSIQTVAPNTDHFFTGHDSELVDYIKVYLDKTL